MKNINEKVNLSGKVPGGGYDSRHPSCYGKVLFPVIGLVLVLLGNLPFFILGGDSVISVREQLDGELVGYILGAKYLFTGTDFYPEFLGGVYKAALTPPSYGTVLFYKMFSPLTAFLINQAFVMIIAFVGMYIWGMKLSGKRFLSFCSALLFAFLPHFTVYGLSVAGVPLVACAFGELLGLKDGLRLYRDGEDKTGKAFRRPLHLILSYAVIGLYGLFSSLVLSGYAVIAAAVIVLIILLIKGKRTKVQTSGKLRMAAGIASLILVYVLLNRDLIGQIVAPGNTYISHKSEFVLSSYPFLQTFTEMLTKGSGAVPSLHIFIFCGAILILAAAGVSYFIGRKNGKIQALLVFMASAVLIALFTAFWHLKPITEMLSRLGGAIKAFQIDRFYWLYPFIWYSVLILIGDLAESLFEKPVFGSRAPGKLKQIMIGNVLWILLLVPCAALVLKESTFKENAMEFVRKQSTALTWNAFFSEVEFKEVADYIRDETGMDQDMYRVGSLGIEPSVSFYNGFRTIDGYSNNYELRYKKRFRKIIEKELEKNAYNRDYFDNWGNRCYLFSSEYYGNPLLTRYEHASFENLELDTRALKDLGCRYILAAGEIRDAENRGLKLCRIFDDYGYTYFIYLYEVM